MLIAIITFKKSEDEMGKIRPSHNIYLKKLYGEGKLLFNGIEKTRLGGVIVAKTLSKDEFEKVMEEDPYVKEDVIGYKIYEIIPKYYDKCLREVIEHE